MRQNGQATWTSPASDVTEGDLLTSISTRRIFTATERMTVTEVGCIIGAAAAEAAPVAPGNFAFSASVRVCGTPANDMVIPVFTAPFAAEGGVAGDPSTLNFNNANQIPNGIITNTLGSFAPSGANTGCILRAYCEQSLNKGDQLVFKVTTLSPNTGARGIFYATAWYDGKGIVEPGDIDSN